MKHNIMHGLHVEWLFDLSVGAQQNQRPGIQKQHDVPFEGELHPWLIRFWWRFGLLGITLMICSSQISSRWRGRIIVSGLNQGTIVIIRIGVHDKVRVGLFVFVPASWNERPTWRKAGGKTLNTQGFQHTCLQCAKISTSCTLSSQTIFQFAVDKCWVRNSVVTKAKHRLAYLPVQLGFQSVQLHFIGKAHFEFKTEIRKWRRSI